MTGTALTQADVAALEKAIARGVRSVQYQNQTVTYQSMAEMLQALDYAKSAIAPTSKPSPSTLAVFSRD